MRPTTRLRFLRSPGSGWGLPFLEGQTGDVEERVAQRLFDAHLAVPVKAKSEPAQPAAEQVDEPAKTEVQENPEPPATPKPTRKSRKTAGE